MTILKEFSNLKKRINAITNKYEVKVISITVNIQGTIDLELDHNIYYKSQAKMVKEIRQEVNNINDIYYRDII
jgi:phosphoribosyl-dephospho-CoA transferase